MSRISRDSSEALDDNSVSLASSDASSSHRLNDVGDVQNLAILQEESKSILCYFTKYLFKYVACTKILKDILHKKCLDMFKISPD